MKTHAILVTFLVLLIFVSGCNTLTTGKTTADVCDDNCQAERDVYIQKTSNLLAQAQEITAKVEDWKTVTKEDLTTIMSLKDEISSLSMPKDFDMAHDYYQRAFNNYVKAIDFIVGANEQHKLASDASNVPSRNIAMSQVINNIQEANKLLIYADEEAKFATRLVSSS